MSDNSLHAEPEKDHFKTESPIRAFTDWKVEGVYALGKGFRPALAHLVPYLNAMEEKEGWQLVQILEALTQHPSFVFRKKVPPMHIVQMPYNPEHAEVLRHHMATFSNEMDALALDVRKIGLGLRQVTADMLRSAENDATPPFFRDHLHHYVDRINGYAAELGVGGHIDADKEKQADALAKRNGIKPADDPINPKHYNGRACADIGERLSANGYQILKYCWRLGGKDEECQELGKAVWYLDSEHALISQRSHHGWRKPDSRGLKPDKIKPFLEDRIAYQPRFVQDVARILWAGYNHQVLSALRARIVQEALHRQCNGNWSAL